MDADKDSISIAINIIPLLLGKYLNDFATNDNEKSSKYYRIINEVPTLILIVVVFVVVLSLIIGLEFLKDIYFPYFL